MSRLASNGNPATSLLQYTNQAHRHRGVDVKINWMAQLADLGIKLPGALTFNTQDSFLQYYRTKQSPASIDPVIDWKDSLGPNLAGTNGGCVRLPPLHLDRLRAAGVQRQPALAVPALGQHR